MTVSVGAQRLWTDILQAMVNPLALQALLSLFHDKTTLAQDRYVPLSAAAYLYIYIIKMSPKQRVYPRKCICGCGKKTQLRDERGRPLCSAPRRSSGAARGIATNPSLRAPKSGVKKPKDQMPSPPGTEEPDLMNDSKEGDTDVKQRSTSEASPLGIDLSSPAQPSGLSSLLSPVPEGKAASAKLRSIAAKLEKHKRDKRAWGVKGKLFITELQRALAWQPTWMDIDDAVSPGTLSD